MNNTERFAYLLRKWEKKRATEEELEALFEFIQDPANEAAGLSVLEERFARHPMREEDRLYWRERLKSQLADILKAKTDKPRLAYLRKRWWIAAAMLGGALLLGLYLVEKQPARQKPALAGEGIKTDIPPGKEGAILTLADGSTLLLDSLGSGLVTSQHGTRILLSNGNLRYDARQAGKPGINTIHTPRSREFMIILPDGSKVWLNAASSLKYPTAFSGKERKVAVTGEAYFEVAPDKARPFSVNINGETDVEVLGTSFNINAYEEEKVSKTTLLEGSVKISRQGGDQAGYSTLLTPGQQALALAGDNRIKTVPADVDKVMAWRRGFFNFEDAGLEDVMRQLARWYDLEVVYKGKAPSIVFGGELSRNVNLSGVLKALKDSKVHFIAEGRKITVLPE